MTTITLAQAEIMINAVFAEARKSNNKPMAVAVTDQGGSVISFKKEDGSSMMRFEMANGKCYASLVMGRSSSLVRYRAEQRPMFMDYLFKASDNKIFAEDGGMLVRNSEGALLGAIGVTGERPERDEELAVIAIHKADYLTDADAVRTEHIIRTEK